MSLRAEAQTKYQSIIYNSFISGKMENWESTIKNMAEQKYHNTDYIIELINYQYGYIAWCIDAKKEKEAGYFIAEMEANLTYLEQTSGESADFHAYTAALYGFKIGLNIWKAPVFGRKSMDHARTALEKDSLSIQANMEMGNIWNYMPEIFGGSKMKALYYYSKAIRIFENEYSKIHNNWNYLNLLVLAGQAAYNQGNNQEAINFYEKALKIEPQFLWVKNELLPPLKN
jgi:tetratricopeptide (TPR) repeat protein